MAQDGALPIHAETIREAMARQGAETAAVPPAAPVAPASPDAAATTAATKTTERPARGERIRQPRVVGYLAIGDAAVVALTGWLSGAAVEQLKGHDFGAGLWLLPIAMAMVAVAVLQRRWCYTIPALAALVPQLGKVVSGLGLAFLGAMALVYALAIEEAFPRSWALLWLTVAVAVLGVGRWQVAHRVARWTAEGRLARRAVVVGGGRHAEEVIAALEGSPDSVDILGIFDDRRDERSPERLGRYQKLGTFESLVDFCREKDIDLLIVTLPLSAEDRLLALLKKLWVLPVDIRLSAHTTKLRFRPRAYTYIGGLPFISLFDKPLSDWNAFLKALEDRVLGTLLLALLSPLMALVALAVRLDSRGPIFFKQKRYGFNNELIEVYKFRSMYVDMSDANAAKLVTRDDPRVTRVGRIIRKTSLDELPQLLNVLKGELSLVGPRPHALQAKSENRLYDDVVDGYFARHKIKPGITGWAQINGWRGETDTVEKIEQRVAHDIAYIDRWSLWFDLYILALTPFALLKSENAY
jgi:Undecaprenyl-phosphate glucose phosphotransferase